MASCSLCNSFGRSKIQYNHDLAREHTEAHFLQLKMVDDEIDMNQIFEKCFPNFATSERNGRTGFKTSRSGIMSSLRGRRTKGSHLAVERHQLCNRLIRKMAERNGYVKCRLCSKGIRAIAMCIKHHAYLHLSTPLYRCRLCTEAFFGVGTTMTHLRLDHALPFLEQNYECLADEHHAEVVGVMNKCYGDQTDSAKEVAFRNVNESNVFKKSAHSKLTLNRRLLCYRLIRKCASVDRRVQCRLCSKQIGVKNGNGITTDRAMQHALLHLGKPVYQCMKCHENYVTRNCILEHLKDKHALPLSETNYRYFADQFHDELEGILRECYEDESKETLTSVKREPISTASVSQQRSKLTIERLALCNQLVREYSDRANDSLQCRLCSNRISVKGTRSGLAMSHALVHLEKPMYRCKICSEMSITRTNVIQHLTRKHALPTANNYECSTDQFHAEIMEMLRKCYNNEIANDSKPFKSRTRAEASVRSRLNGSKLTIERQIFCYRLITKFVSSDCKVECRLCKKRPVAKRGEYNVCGPALTHAMVHLKKPIYRCVVCSETCPYDSYMKNHLKVTHALPLANNYECLADEYHSEILSQLSQCYGELRL